MLVGTRDERRSALNHRNRITLGLVLQLPDGVERDVRVEGDRNAPARELAAKLARFAGVADDHDLFLPRGDIWPPGSTPIGSLGLAHGDAMVLALRSNTGKPPAAADHALELVAVGGSSMTSRWPLHQGEHVVGRNKSCDVRVDDRSLSRSHFRIHVEGHDVYVSDLASTNGTFIDGVRVSDRRVVTSGDVIEAGTSLFQVQPANPGIAATDKAPDADGFISFNRPPRIASPRTEESFMLSAPPARQDATRLPPATALLPLLIALLLWRLMPDNPSLLAIMLLSPLMALVSFAGERTRSKKRRRRDELEWEQDLERVVTEVAAARTAAAESLRHSAPDAAQLERTALYLTPQLWQRRPTDDDFLMLRCGWGDTTWIPLLTRDPGGAKELQRQATARLEPLLVLPSVPLTVRVPDAGVVGFCGDRERVVGQLRWSVLQTATLHSPEEVLLAPILGVKLSEEWRWLSWLPHVAEVTSASAPSAIAARLLDVLDARRSRAEGGHDLPAVLVLLDEAAEAPGSITARLLREGPAAGIYVLWLGTHRNDLPGECGSTVEMTARGNDVTITTTRDGAVQHGAAESVDRDTCRGVARALAPVRDAAPRRTSEQLPRGVTLFESLDARDVDISTVTRYWATSGPDLRAPLGLGEGGPFIIDILNDGPHALVGGTTGAGKSELLRTLIASLALRYPPTRLNFLLIDYKGGTAFKQCIGFPHTVGLVTDLDPRLSQRALVSLDAEVRRRERLLRDANARDIAELETDSTLVLPRLVLVIDEFATLVKELPSFVDGVVDIAQRGRGLGIHLVLATQRPAGVINEAIRANTNIRICLRVADEPDSEDVVGTRDAARIPRSLPGRAYVRRGQTEIEEIQTAFSGSPVVAARAPVQVRDRLAPQTAPADTEGPTQLEQVVDLTTEAADGRRLARARSPWLPPLPDTISSHALPPEATVRPPTVAAFGLIDRPDLQAREVASFDLEKDAHLLVYGAGGSGKTLLLHTIAGSLANSLSPTELHIYGLDFGSGGLRPLRSLPHCGDVVAGEEHDRVRRLFSMILTEISRRKRLFAARKIGRLAEWDSDGGFLRPPHIVVLLDGYPAFASAFERIDMGRTIDSLPGLVSDGRAAGLHFVISSDRHAAVPSSLTASIPIKVILRQADADDYLVLGLEPRSIGTAHLPPGRGFIKAHELQVALPPPLPEANEDQAAPTAGSASSGLPPPVELLPSSVDAARIEIPSGRFRAAVGLRESDLTPLAISVKHRHFLVAGPYRSGRSTCLATLAHSLGRSTPDASLHLLAPRRTWLSRLDLWDEVALGSDACGAHLDALETHVEADPTGTVLVFVDDADELAETPADHALERLVKRGRDASLRFIAATEPRALQRAFTGWLAEVRKDRHGLLLDPEAEVDGELLGVRLPRSHGEPRPPGRGYVVAGGRAELIQVARHT